MADSSETASRSVRWALLAFAILLIVVARSPDAILLPSLEAEDGTFVFPYYYAYRDAADLLRFQGGYIPLTLNLIAYLSVKLPTTFIPYGFAWFPLLLATMAYVWLFGRPFARWLGSDATRAFICLLFVLAPVGQYHLYANTTYSIWNALLLLVLIVVTPPSQVGWRNLIAWAAANVLVWSNPLTILIAPVVMLRLVRERRARVLHTLTLANLVLYNSIGVESSAIFAGLTLFESIGKVVNAIGWTFTIAAGTAFRAIFGAPLYARLEAGYWPPVVIWAIGVIVAAALAARQSPPLRPVLMGLGYVIFGFTFLSVLGRGASTLVPLNGAPRYIYIPTLACLVLYVLLLEHFVVVNRLRRRVVVYGAVVVLYGALNAQLGHYFVATGPAARPSGRAVSPYVQSDAGNGPIVREFFAELARLEAEKGSREDIELTADKPGDWPIIANTRTPPPRR